MVDQFMTLRSGQNNLVHKCGPGRFYQVACTSDNSSSERLSIIQKSTNRPAQFRMFAHVAGDLAAQCVRPHDEHIPRSCARANIMRTRVASNPKPARRGEEIQASNTPNRNGHWE